MKPALKFSKLKYATNKYLCSRIITDQTLKWGSRPFPKKLKKNTR